MDTNIHQVVLVRQASADHHLQLLMASFRRLLHPTYHLVNPLRDHRFHYRIKSLVCLRNQVCLAYPPDLRLQIHLEVLGEGILQELHWDSGIRLRSTNSSRMGLAYHLLLLDTQVCLHILDQ
jgi:hypothetical protein